jgi:hypothetical protein
MSSRVVNYLRMRNMLNKYAATDGWMHRADRFIQEKTPDMISNLFTPSSKAIEKNFEARLPSWLEGVETSAMPKGRREQLRAALLQLINKPSDEAAALAAAKAMGKRELDAAASKEKQKKSNAAFDSKAADSARTAMGAAAVAGKDVPDGFDKKVIAAALKGASDQQIDAFADALAAGYTTQEAIAVATSKSLGKRNEAGEANPMAKKKATSSVSKTPGLPTGNVTFGTGDSRIVLPGLTAKLR